MAGLQLLLDRYILPELYLHFERYTIIVTMHVEELKLLFHQYTLSTGIHLHFPRYTISVTMHEAVLQLLFEQTIYIPVFPFNSHVISFLSLCM